MAVRYVGSVQYAAVTAWATLTSKSAGNLIRPTAPTAGNERVFICIIAGTTLASEPTWTNTKGAKTAEAAGPTWQECTGESAVCGDVVNTTASSAVRSTTPALGKIVKNNTATHYFIVTTSGACGSGEPTYDTTTGNTTTDSSCTWTCIGAVGAFSAFQAPHVRLTHAFTSTWGAAGDTFYVADDHAYSVAASYTITGPGTITSPCNVYCIDKTVAPPTTSAHLKVTGSESTTGANTLTYNSIGLTYGLTFSAGSGAVNSTLTIANASTAGTYILSNCKLIKAGTTASTSSIILGGGNTAAYTILDNTTIQFGNTGDRLRFDDTKLYWKNTVSLIAGATIPTTLFNFTVNIAPEVIFEGVDFSGLGSNSLFLSGFYNFRFKFINCKLSSTSSLVPASPAQSGLVVDFINCSSDTKNYLLNRYTRFGQQTTITNPIRTSGASDGTTTYAWNITTTADAEWVTPYESFRCSIWNDITASNRTVTMYGVLNTSICPRNDSIWLTADYLGSSATPQASFATTTKTASFLVGTSILRDGSTWNSAASARANSTAYTSGTSIVSTTGSGNNNVLFCTTSGTSASSAPTTATTWTTRTSAADVTWNAICWSPELSLFCAVSSTGTANRVMTSPDGITWTTRTYPEDNQWFGVCWAAELGLFCAVGITGTNRVMTSPDGITWTARAASAANQWINVCWSPELSLFCAVANTGTATRVMTSPDGITWTTRTSAADNDWRGLVWASELRLFCAVSSAGTNRVMTSPDGITWTSRSASVANSWYGLAWAPELSLFCSVAITGTSNRVMTSPDGITWTTRTSAADNDWRGFCWSGGYFCAVSVTGTGNRVMTSPDGITWTTRTSAADNDWRGVAYAPSLGLFAAVGITGTGNRVMTSPDGVDYPGTGGVVTDNTVVWRAGWRFKLTTTFSSPQPGLKGYIHTQFNVATVSTTYYVDPKIVLS